VISEIFAAFFLEVTSKTSKLLWVWRESEFRQISMSSGFSQSDIGSKIEIIALMLACFYFSIRENPA
ncbi:MAG: hypothetical protein ACC618_03610, partial [Patescibacteria group bacterium]